MALETRDDFEGIRRAGVRPIQPEVQEEPLPEGATPGLTDPASQNAVESDRRRRFEEGLPIPVYRRNTPVASDPAERKQQLETRLRREGRSSLFWKVLEVLARAEAPTAALIHKSYEQQVVNGASPNIMTWLTAVLDTYATTPLGIPTGAVLGGAIAGGVGAGVGAGASLVLNAGAAVADPDEYWDNLQLIYDAFRGEIRSGRMPIDIVTTLQNVEGMPTAGAYVVGIGIAMINPADVTNLLPIGSVRRAAKLTVRVSERTFQGGKTLRATADEFALIRQARRRMPRDVFEPITEFKSARQPDAPSVFRAGEEGTERIDLAMDALGPGARGRTVEEFGGLRPEDIGEMEARQARDIDLPLSADGSAEQHRLTAKYQAEQVARMDPSAPEDAHAIYTAAVEGRRDDADAGLRDLMDMVAESQSGMSPFLREVGAPGKATRRMQSQVLDAVEIYEQHTGAGAKRLKDIRARISEDVDREAWDNALRWLEDPEQTFKHIIQGPEQKALRDTMRFTYDTLVPSLPHKGFPFLAKGVTVPLTPTLRGWKWRAAAYGSMGATFGYLSVEPEDTYLDVAKKILFGGALVGFLGARGLGTINASLLRAHRALETGKALTAKAEGEVNGHLLGLLGGEGVKRLAQQGLALYATLATTLGEKWASIAKIPRGNSPAHEDLAENIGVLIRMLRSTDSTQQVIAEQVSRDFQRMVKIAMKAGGTVPAEKLAAFMNNALELKGIDLTDAVRETEARFGGRDDLLPVPVEPEGSQLPVEPIAPGSLTPDLSGLPDVAQVEGGAVESTLPVDVQEEFFLKGRAGETPVPETTSGPPTPRKEPAQGELLLEGRAADQEHDPDLLTGTPRQRQLELTPEQEKVPLTPEERRAISDEIRAMHDEALGAEGITRGQVQDAVSDAISDVVREELTDFTPDMIARRVIDLLAEQHGMAIPEALTDSDTYILIHDQVAADLFRRSIAQELRIVDVDTSTNTVRFTHLGSDEYQTEINRAIQERPTTLTTADTVPTHSTGTDTEVKASDRPARPARFAVMDVNDLVPSHGRIDDGRFRLVSNANPEFGYPHEDLGDNQFRNANTRAYDRDKPAQRKLDRNFQDPPNTGEGLDVRLLANDLPDPSTGPPIVGVWQDKPIVVGGNFRFIRILRMYAASSDEIYRNTYKERILQLADQFGLDPAAIEAVQSPVIVRVLDESPENYADMRSLIDEMNVEATQATDAAVRMSIRLKALPDNVQAALQNLIDQFPEGMSVQQALRRQPSIAREFLGFLRQHDLIDENQVNRIWNERNQVFKESGADTVRDMLYALVSDDPEVMELFGSQQSFATGHLRGVRYLRQIDEFDTGFADDVTKALGLYHRYILDTDQLGTRTPFNKWIEKQQAQGGLFTGASTWPELTERQESLLQWLHLKRRSPNQIQEAYRDYAKFLTDYHTKQPVIGEVPDNRTPLDAFAEAFGQKANARAVALENIRTSLQGQARTEYQEALETAIKNDAIDVSKQQLGEYMVVSDAMGRAAMKSNPERYKSLDDWYRRPVRATGEEAGDGVFGSISYTSTAAGEPTLLLTLFREANLSTLLHEDAHLLRAALPDEDIALLEDVYQLSRRGARGAEFEERFAEDFEVYMETGLAPTAELRTTFRKIADWMTDIFKDLAERFTSYERGDAIDDRVRDLFDRHLGTSEDDVVTVKKYDPPDPDVAPTREELIGDYAWSNKITASQATALLDSPTEREVHWLGYMAERHGNAAEYYKAREAVAPAPPAGDIQGTLMQKVNSYEHAKLVKRNLGVVTGGKFNATEAGEIVKRFLNELAHAEVRGTFTPEDILSGRLLDEVVQHAVAHAAGLGGNPQFFDRPSLRNYFQQLGGVEQLQSMFKVARMELGIADDTEDLFLAYVAPLLALRAGYRALHFGEQMAGLNVQELTSQFIEYHYHLIDQQARRHLQKSGFLEKNTDPGEGLNAQAPFSLMRRKRVQFVLLDASLVQKDEFGMPHGITESEEAFRAFDDETVAALKAAGKVPETMDTRAKLLGSFDQDIRDAFRIRLPGQRATLNEQKQLMGEGGYFQIRMGDAPIELDGKTYWVVEMPFSDLPLTMANRLYRSHTLRSEAIEDIKRAGKVDPDDYEARYFDHEVHVIGAEADEPLFVTDPGVAFAARQAQHRRAVLKTDLLAHTLANPWYGKPALTSTPDMWQREIQSLISGNGRFDDMSAEEIADYITRHYVLAHGGGDFHFVLRRRKPLAVGRDEIIDMQEAFPGDTANLYYMVHTTRDAKGEKKLWEAFPTAGDRGLTGDARLNITKTRDLMSFASIKHTLANTSDERVLRGAEKALMTRTTAVADDEVARLLNDSYEIYEPVTNQYRGVMAFFQERLAFHRRNAALGRGDVWRLAFTDTKDEYRDLGIKAAAWGAFEHLGSMWARFTISGFPATRVRDILGNFNTMALSGFNVFRQQDLDSLWQAHGLMRGNRLTVNVGETAYDGEELMQILVREGILTGAYTGSDLHLNDAIQHVMGLDYRQADMPFDRREYYEKLIRGREKVGDKWVFTGLRPGTALLYRNVLLPAGAGAAIGASTEEGGAGRGAIRGAILGGALGTAFGASRLAVGRAGNRFTMDTLNVRNRKMLEVYRGTDSGFGYVTRTIGAHYENIQKAAFFLSMLKRGFTPADAALRVNQAIMTIHSVPTGLAKARPWMPFYRWTAFNLPAQYRGFLERPRVAARLGRAVADLQSNFENPDNLYVPSWIMDQPHVLIGQEPVSGRTMYYTLGNWIPTLDLAEMLDPTQLDRTVPSLLTPLLTTGLEQVANRNIYFQRPLDRFASFGETATQIETFLGINMVSRTANILRKIRILRDLHALSGQDPLSFLENAAERTERTQRAAALRRNESTESIVLGVFSSSFGVLPRRYLIDVDKNRKLLVWRVKEALQETRAIARYASRRPTTAAEKAQFKQAMNPWQESSPGFNFKPIDATTPADRRTIRTLMEGR